MAKKTAVVAILFGTFFLLLSAVSALFSAASGKPIRRQPASHPLEKVEPTDEGMLGDAGDLRPPDEEFHLHAVPV